MDLPHWALDLSHPLSVEVGGRPPGPPGITPPWLIVRYQHPARKKAGTGETLPPVSPDVVSRWPAAHNPPHCGAGQYFKERSALYRRERQLLADYYPAAVAPRSGFQGLQGPAPFIANSIGHHREWVEACRKGGPTTCNFDYSGALSEAALLGNVVYRVGGKIEWDAKRLRPLAAAKRTNTFTTSTGRAGDYSPEPGQPTKRLGAEAAWPFLRAMADFALGHFCTVDRWPKLWLSGRTT